MRKETRLTGLSYIFFPLATVTLSESEENLNTKTKITYKVIPQLGKTNELQGSCFSKTKQQFEGALRPWKALRTLWLAWKTQEIHVTMCFTNYDKK